MAAVTEAVVAVDMVVEAIAAVVVVEDTEAVAAAKVVAATTATAEAMEVAVVVAMEEVVMAAGETVGTGTVGPATQGEAVPRMEAGGTRVSLN